MNSKKSILTVLLLVLTLAAGTVLPGIPAKADSVSTPYLALGADLTPGERETVFSLLNVDPDELDDYNVLYVTNKDEHNYLDQYISSSVIGTRALSCVLIQKRTEGYGLQVTTHNITYCTPSMYINALSTAGITDSRVVVAGPFPISGTAALVGAMKAYEDMTGEEITEEFQDAAMNELVVEGLLGESFEDGEDDAADAEVEEFIRELKLEVSEREFNEETEREEIEDLIRQKATERNLELSQELLDKIADLMEKIDKLNLDKEQIQKQTEVITETPEEASSNETSTQSTQQAGDSTEANTSEQKEDPAASTEGNKSGDTAKTENQDQTLIQGQEQLDSFNAFFQDEDKTLALLTSIQDDISKAQAEDSTDAELTQDQKREIVKKEFINHGVIPAEEAEAEGADLSAYDSQIDKTVLIIDNIDLFNLDLEGYRERTASTDAASPSAADSSQTSSEEGSEQAGKADGAEESSQTGETEESSQTE